MTNFLGFAIDSRHCQTVTLFWFSLRFFAIFINCSLQIHSLAQMVREIESETKKKTTPATHLLFFSFRFVARFNAPSICLNFIYFRFLICFALFSHNFKLLEFCSDFHSLSLRMWFVSLRFSGRHGVW